MSNTTPNNQTTFQNDNINVTLTREPGCRISLDVRVSPQATQASYQKALKNINKEVSIPGFRKGKAPSALIHKTFAKHIENEWKDILLNTSFEEAIHLSKSYPFRKNSLKTATVKQASQQEGATLFFEYEEFPRVPSVVPQDLAIDAVPRKAVTEKDIEEAIEDLRLRQAEWHDITDRPVQEGDFVEIDIDALSEPARNICTNARVPVRPDKMGAWLCRLIIGLNVGDTVEGMSEKEEPAHLDAPGESCSECDHEHSHEEEKFVPTLCRVTLHAIKQPTWPPLDDELAKKYGAPTFAELKQRLINTLERRADEDQRQAQRRLMEWALISKYQFDVPYSLVEEDFKERRKAVIDELRRSGKEEESIGSEIKNIEEQILVKIVLDYQMYFLATKVNNENHLEVSQEELQGEWLRHLWLQSIGQQPNSNPQPEEMREQLHLQLLITKALDFLIDSHSR